MQFCVKSSSDPAQQHPETKYYSPAVPPKSPRLEGRALEHATSKKSGQGVRMKVDLCGPLRKKASGDFGSTAGL